MNVTYIEYFYVGSFFSESSTAVVENRNRPENIPGNAFAYRFFDREEMVVDGEKLMGSPKNYSGTTYFGEEMTLDDVIKNVPNSEILQSNMRSNGYKTVVKTRRGNFQPVQQGDTVLAQ